MNNDNNDTPILDFTCQVIAGYNWSPSKYIFSSNNDNILIPCGSCIRVYNVSDGSYLYSLPSNEDDLLLIHGDKIVSIQAHPYFCNEYILCFTNKRKLVIIFVSL